MLILQKIVIIVASDLRDKCHPWTKAKLETLNV